MVQAYFREGREGPALVVHAAANWRPRPPLTRTRRILLLLGLAIRDPTEFPWQHLRREASWMARCGERLGWLHSASPGTGNLISGETISGETKNCVGC